MANEDFDRKLTAILSEDVAGNSRLMGDDEAATVRTLKYYRYLITEKVQAFKGRVVDSPGDNILAEFKSIVDAVSCAVEIQNMLKEQNEDLPEDRKMVFRIGVNLGDVIQDNERIYGDGVNIAARVEGLAKPGAVAISGTAFDSVRNKLKFGFEFVGEHQVKNIAQPVRVYHVLTDPADSQKVIGEPEGDKTAMPKTILAIALVIFLLGATYFYIAQKPTKDVSTTPQTRPLEVKKPSIAVLAFDNMSNDPEQEYFSDGISEDLITDLSKNPELFVISRFSSFTYKDKPVKVQQIAEELGVQYVLEGSVRKVDNNVRINAQLIDGSTGHHLWAERYDGDMSNIFKLQDKITQKITASLAIKLTEEKDPYAPKGTSNIEAYEAFLRSSDIANYLRMDPEGMAKAIPWFEKAIKLDPDYSEAYAGLAEAYLRGTILGIHRKLGISYRLARMRAAKYLRMASKNPTHLSHRELARWYLARWQHEKAFEHAERAVALNPNDPDNNSIMAQVLIYSNKPDQAIAFSERMRRADPACLS